MGYTKDAIKGISWLGAFRAFSRALSFLRTVIVARVLLPYQFGIYGIATLILALIEILTETGINVFLIQNKENSEKYINTAWIVSIVRGFLISIVIIASARFVSDFFKNPEVVPLLMSISIVSFVRGFINPSVVKFQKELNFNKEFYYRSSIFLVETLFSILLVIIMKNPIALIYGLIAGAFFEVTISFKFVNPKPNFNFNGKIFNEIVSRGKWITSSSILSYLFQNGDNVIIGRVLGTGPLGIYDMAYNISMLPINEISDIVARVTFPVYVKISEERKRLRTAYLKTSIITVLFVTPLLLIFLFFPQQLILLFLGPNWVNAEDLLRILAVSAFMNTLSSPTGAVFFAVGKQKYLSILTGISLVTMIVLIIPFINKFGLAGGAIAVVIGSAAALPFQIYFLIKVLYKTQ